MSEYLTTSDRSYTAPAAADSIALPHPGVAYGNGPWFEILAAAPVGGAYLTDVCLVPLVYSAYRFNQEIDVGVGAAGAETVISTFKLHGIITNLNGNNFDCPLPLWVDAIPGGARVAVRFRSSRATAGSNTAYAALSYVAKPITGERLSTTKPYKCWPSNASAVSVVSGADMASGAWAEIIASTPVDWMLVASWMASDSVGDAIGVAEWDVGIGAAGSEEVVGTYRYGFWSMGSYHPRPFFLGGWVLDRVIPAGSRIVIRTRGYLDEGESNWAWIHYMEAPL